MPPAYANMTPRRSETPAAEATAHDAPTRGRRILGALRVTLGFIFFWAFLDKTFGLGYSTPAARAWINGGSPTRGFLANTEGWLASTFQAMAGVPLVDWLFMLGLLGVGLALILGVGLRVAAVSGATMMMLMWAASMPVATNPLVDDHVVYALVLLALPALRAGDGWGLGARWRALPLVRKHPILE